MSARCRNGHALAEVGFRIVSGKVVCKGCARAAQSRYRRAAYSSVPQPGDWQDGGPLADPDAPSEAEVARKAAIVRALVEDDRRQRTGIPFDCVPRMGTA